MDLINIRCIKSQLTRMRRWLKTRRWNAFQILLLLSLYLFLIFLISHQIAEYTPTKVTYLFGGYPIKTTVSSISNAARTGKGKTWKKNHTTSLVTRNLYCSRGLLLVILVTSHAFSGQDRRATIRETWGTFNASRTGNMSGTWQTFFLVGTHFSGDLSIPFSMRAKTARLRDEIAHHHDMIEGNFVEHWDNLSYKLQIGFEWATLYCSSHFVVKTDDDSFVNTKTLIPFLHTVSKKELYTGHVCRDYEVQREGKYMITFEEYPGDVYPTFVSGATMVFSIDVLRILVKVFHSERYFKLEDVYIGLLMDRLSIAAYDADPEGERELWDVERYSELEHECEWFTNALIRAVHFWEHDKRWCLYKMYENT